MNEKTLGVIVHKIISYIRKEMKDVWEATIKKTHNWMIDETSGLVGVKTDEGVRKYLKRYFWGIKANVQKLVWFIYEHGSRGLKAIRQFLWKGFKGASLSWTESKKSLSDLLDRITKAWAL